MKLKMSKKQTSLGVITLLAMVVTVGLTVWGRIGKAQDFMTAKVEEEAFTIQSRRLERFRR